MDKKPENGSSPINDLRQQLLDADADFEAAKRLEKFICSVCKIPAGHELPDGFEEEWDNLLKEYESQIKEYFEQQPDAPERWELAIKRGWVVADEEAKKLVSHLELPDQSLHPIPAILHNEAGKWELASIMVTMVRAHPYVRVVTEKLPVLTTQEEVLEAIANSKAIQTDEPHGANLSLAADRLELFLYEPSFGADERHEFGWMADAKSSQHFWHILDSAIGFGRSLERYESLGSGKAQELAIQGLMPRGGKPEGPYKQIIRRLMDSYAEEHDHAATAKKLLVWIGGKAGNADNEPLILPDEHLKQLAGITWDQWKNTVGTLKKS